MNDGLYDALAAAVRGDRPVALATVIAGPGTGAKLLVGPDEPTVGTLGVLLGGTRSWCPDR